MQSTPGGELAEITLNFGGSMPVEFSIPLGNWKIGALGLGGWSLSNNHFLEFSTKRLYLGSGEIREIEYLDLGGGEYGVTIDSENEIYIFNSQGRHLRTLAGLTGATKGTFTYNSNGRLLTYKNAYNKITTFTRNPSGVLTSISTPYSVTTTVNIDSSGNLVSVTNPASQTYNMTYTSGGLLQTFTKPTGEVTTFSIDGDGNITGDSHSGGASLSYLTSLLPTYKEHQSTSAMGRSESTKVYTSISYSQWRQINSLGVTQEYTEGFGSNGQIINKVGDINDTRMFEDDPRLGDLDRKPLSLVEKQGTLTRTTNFTNSASLSDPADPFSIISLSKNFSINGKSYTNSYAPGTRRWTLTTPSSRTFISGTNAYQMPNYLKNGSDTAITLAYNTFGRLSSITQSTRVTSFGYNAQGYLSTVTNALSQATSYAYNTAGQVSSITTPDSRTISFTYDSTGRLASITPPGKPIHNFYYNALELLQKYLPASLGGTPDPTEYAYNNDKQLTKITRPDATEIDYVYNATTGVLEKMKIASTDFFTFTYETTKGLIASVTSFSGLKNTYSYQGSILESNTLTDAATGTQITKVSKTISNDFLVTALSLNGNSASPTVSTSLGYDNDGFLTSTTEATYQYATNSHNVSLITLGKTTESFGYNTFSEKTSSTAKYLTTTLYATTLTRDALGRVATLSESIGGVTTGYGYTYDSSGRLTVVTKNSVTDETFTYDNNNNITSGTSGASSFTGTYDNQDRVLTFKDYSFTHNVNGEMTSKQNTLTSATTAYGYNVMGYLTTVTLPSTDVVSYEYDGEGRRVARDFNGTPTHFFIYDHQYQIVGDLDSSGNVSTKYIYASQGHSPDYMVRGGVKYKFIKNHLGSVRLVVNESTGVVAQRIDYDTYGKVLADTNPGFQPFGFAGGLYDAETGLVRFGVRDYDAETGRWTTKDPIGFDSGDTNLFSYVASDPVNFVDPEGDTRSAANVLMNPTLGGGVGPALVGATTGAAAGELIGKLLNWFTEKHTKLKPWEIDKLKEAGVDPEQLKTETTGKKKTGGVDLFKGPNGDICVKPKDGKGPGEPTGININDIINGTRK